MENSMYKVLLVDDEKNVLEFLGYSIKKEGYQVVTASNGVEAIEKANSELPHLIVMDVMMPELDGIEACREIRKNAALKSTIIIFLTARGEDYSQIAGFEAGADDYVNKPVKPRVLISRIRALLRRYKDSEPEQKMVELGEITIDKEKYVVNKAGKEIYLPKKEFELLCLLASKVNKVFTREEIFVNVWGNDVVVGDRTIDVHIRKIREKLNLKSIKTVKGVGYMYEVSENFPFS